METVSVAKWPAAVPPLARPLPSAGLAPRSPSARTTRRARGLATPRFLWSRRGVWWGEGHQTTRHACAGPRRLGSIRARDFRRRVAGTGLVTLSPPHPAARPPSRHGPSPSIPTCVGALGAFGAWAKTALAMTMVEGLPVFVTCPVGRDGR